MIDGIELPEKEWGERFSAVRPKMKKVFYVGDIDLLDGEMPVLAVVGSRKMTRWGMEIVEAWVPRLVKAGVVIISGFMYGVDKTAHRVCVESRGKTIAVLGYSIDRIDIRDLELYRKIIGNGGLVISEYPRNTEGARWTFPQRDRVIAGLCDAIWVVEGAEKSGSLLTARLGAARKKTILGVPRDLDCDQALGVGNLIDSRTALAVKGAEDILKILGMNRSS